jgi:ketosteroid isomerase-like protein
MKASEQKLRWLSDYYAALDAGRYGEVAGCFTPDVRTLYPMGIEVVGRDALMTQTERSLGALERIRHEIVNVWEEDDELVFELDVTYWRRDGGVLTRRGMAIFVLDDGLIAEQRLFVDLNGVWG